MGVGAKGKIIMYFAISEVHPPKECQVWRQLQQDPLFRAKELDGSGSLESMGQCPLLGRAQMPSAGAGCCHLYCCPPLFVQCAVARWYISS
jgi:hypothetical protein